MSRDYAQSLQNFAEEDAASPFNAELNVKESSDLAADAAESQ